MSKYYKEKFLIIRVNLYNLELPSGEIVKSDKVDLEKKHIDTNCMIFLKVVFLIAFLDNNDKRIICYWRQNYV